MLEEKKETRVCPNCRKVFLPNTKKQHWCSRKCRDAYQHRARRRIKKAESNDEKEKLRTSFYTDRVEIKRNERRQYPKLFSTVKNTVVNTSIERVLEIPLVGNGIGKCVIIDDTPQNKRFLNIKISLDHYGYPILLDSDFVHVHHLILGFPSNDLVVDHINRNILDCRSKNLRFVSKGENNFNKAERADNTTGKTGVYFNQDENVWYSKISKDGETYNLGHYKKMEDAIDARETAELELYGYTLNGVMDNSHTRVMPASQNRGMAEKSRLKRSPRKKKRT